MNNSSALFQPKCWKKPSPKEMAEYFSFLGSRRENTKGGLLVFRKHLSPLSVYKYLVARFGNPYGFQTMVKKPDDSNNLFHWDYIIKADDKWIYINGGNRDVHVAVFGETLSSNDWVKLAAALKNDFKRFGREMQEVGNKLEKWNIVSNRFVLIADACSRFHEILTDSSEVPNFRPVKRSSEEGIELYRKQIQGMGERAEKVFSASLSLDLITPILAEAFINLLIFVMRKEELKKNNRQYEQYIRQPIDTRVYDLHLKCDHFERGVDPDSEEYKAFKRVMDRRNYNLHGNIDPKKDVIETVYFDKTTPLFENGGDPILELFANQERIYDVSGVLSRYNDVHMFFSYVLGLIKDGPREEFELVISESNFGFDVSRGRLGKLFPSVEVMMLVPAEYDDELDVEWC